MQRTNKYIYQLINSEGDVEYEGSALSISQKYSTVIDNVYQCYMSGRLYVNRYKLEKYLNPEYNFTKLTPMKPLIKDGKWYCSNCGFELRNTWVCCPNCEWRIDKK